MDVALASKVEGDYLLTEVRGRIANLSELKQLTQRFYAEILKYGLTKILIDERDTTFPRSVEHSIELVHYLSEDFPEEIRSWKIALVMDSHFKPIGDFFQFQAQKMGFQYKVFTSLADARQFVLT